MGYVFFGGGRMMSLQEYVQWLLDNEPEYFYAKIFEAEAEGEE